MIIGITGIGAYFGAQCEKHGMLVRVSGDNIMMSPPFIMSPEEVDEVGFNKFLIHLLFAFPISKRWLMAIDVWNYYDLSVNKQIWEGTEGDRGEGEGTQVPAVNCNGWYWWKKTVRLVCKANIFFLFCDVWNFGCFNKAFAYHDCGSLFLFILSISFTFFLYWNNFP